MLIDTLTGSENFPGMVAKAHLFAVASTAFPNSMGEAHLFSAAKGGWAISRHGGGGRIAAGEGMSDAMGFFSQTQYDIPEGMILKVFAMKRVGPEQTRMATQFIKLRDGAALNRIEIPLTGYHKATLRSAWIEGRFDILSLAQAEKAGVRVNPMHRAGFDPVKVRGIMNLRVLSPETKAAPTIQQRVVTNSHGEEITVAGRASKRMLDV